MIMSPRVCASVYCEICQESENGKLPLLLSGVSVYDDVLGLAVDVRCHAEEANDCCGLPRRAHGGEDFVSETETSPALRTP